MYKKILKIQLPHLKIKKGENENTTTNHTTYPRKYMSVKELVPFGFSEHELKQCLKIKGFPAYKMPGRTGKWRIDTTKLDSWLMRRFGVKGE